MSILSLKTQNFRQKPPFQLEMFPPDQKRISRKQVWAANRFWMEMKKKKIKRYQRRWQDHWYEHLFLLKFFEYMLQVAGLYQKGLQNAKNIKLKEHHLYFSNLPDSFDNFTILHLSDLHFGSFKGIENRIVNIMKNRSVDLVIFTGDYQLNNEKLQNPVIKKLQFLMENIDSRVGCLAILGNHDGCHMVNPMEKIGLKLLINSSCHISRGKEKIKIIGTDDVHYYYTDQAIHALENANNDFSIALVHSPELFDIAAVMGVDLYLCGHTHGGQICLPGGKALLKHLYRGRKYYKGHWRYNRMQGITSSGIGTSGMPVRYNSQGEVLIHHLYRLKPDPKI